MNLEQTIRERIALRQNPPRLNVSGRRLFAVGRLGAMLLLTIGIIGAPYGFYQFLRLWVCAVSVSIAYVAHFHFKATSLRYAWEPESFDSLAIISAKFELWRNGAIGWAMLFNPIFPLHLKRELWVLIDSLTILLLVSSFFKLRDSSAKTQEK